MAMPTDLVLVRHGLSEANVIQRAEKNGEPHPLANLVYARHDTEQRLAYEGIQQAKTAGLWLDSNFIPAKDFDERYASPMYRTLETAQYIGGAACEWLPEMKILERDWGIFGATPLEERKERFADTLKMQKISSFLTRLDGGESMFDVTLRFQAWIGRLSQEQSGKKVIAVTHGELMWAARYVMERMTPQEYHSIEADKSLRIGNCCILWYSRQNPNDPEDTSKSLSDGWRRMVDPYEPDKSPYGGDWQKLEGKRRFGSVAIQSIISQSPPILERHDELN